MGPGRGEGMRRLLCLAALLSCLLVFPSLAAVATPSNWLPEGWVPEDSDEVPLDSVDGDLVDDTGLYLYLLQNSFGVASPSNASLSDGSLGPLQHIESLLSDIHQTVVPSAEEEVEDDPEDFGEDGIEFYALSDNFSLNRNVIIYEGKWQGQDCRLVLPASTAVTLFVADDGALYNVGTSNIVGKIFYGDFEPLVYNNQYVFTLTPSLSNNASTLYNNGYPSYCTRYYYSSGSLRSTATYGLFSVTKVVKTPSDLPESVNGVYLLVLVLIGGVMVLCYWKKSPRL